MFDLFDELQCPLTHNLNSMILDHHPDIGERMMARGDEFVAHGRSNSERQGDMWEEDEARLIAETTETIRKFTGKNPFGWMSPWLSQSRQTLDLLQEAGYLYQCDWPLDDQPIWFRTKHGPILSIPYAHDLNDSLEAVTRRTPSQLWCENVVDHFDEMLEESARRPLVMSIVLHSFILGQPRRLRRFRRVIEHILKQRERIWLTRPGEICRYVETLPPGTVPGG